MRGRIGVITGLASESRRLRRTQTQDLDIRCAGASAKAAGDLARAFIEEGAAAIIVCGIGGGLADGLAGGTLVVADAVLDTGAARHACDADLRDSLLAMLDGSVRGDILGLDAPACTPAEKRRLRARTGALVCDMESHGVARAAASAGVPFCVVRAVADPLARAVPDWLAGAIGDDGRARLGWIVRGLVRRPGDLGALWALKRDAALALDGLGRVAPVLGGLRG